VKFKYPSLEAQWYRLIPEVQTIVREADVFLQNAGTEVILTNIYRSPHQNDELYGGKGDHLYGPHVLYHAADVRSWHLDDDLKLALFRFIDSRWLYDRKRPTKSVILLEGGADPGSTGEHFHFQALPSVTMPRVSLPSPEPSA
jgi:hypothetical protein